MSFNFKDSLASSFYHDRQFNCDAAKILPGEYYYTDRDMVIVTVLGSCVAACIRDRVSGIGGMNHFMLPDTGSEHSNQAPSMRYGTHAMDVLISELLKAGARRENLEAKVFGGGRVLSTHMTMNVGGKNATFVLEYLKEQKITVLAEDLNDYHARKVHYFPRTGKVLVKKVQETQINTLVQREQDYLNRFRRAAGL